MLRYTANYAHTNHNFVIQNLNGNRIDNHFTPPVCVLKNILQRGTPTLMSRYLQSKLGKIQDHPEFKLPLPLISNVPPRWMRTIGGDEKKNYYPAKTFFYEVIPHYLPEYRQILQLMLPEASINDINQVEVDDFVDQRVDFFLPQANLVNALCVEGWVVSSLAHRGTIQVGETWIVPYISSHARVKTRRTSSGVASASTQPRVTFAVYPAARSCTAYHSALIFFIVVLLLVKLVIKNRSCPVYLLRLLY